MTESDTSSCPSCFSCSRTASTVTPPRECDAISARSLRAGRACEDGVPPSRFRSACRQRSGSAPTVTGKIINNRALSLYFPGFKARLPFGITCVYEREADRSMARQLALCFVAAHRATSGNSCRLALPRTSTGAPTLSRDERCSRQRACRPRRSTCARARAGETVPDASSRDAPPARRHRITTSDAWRRRPPSPRDGSPPRRPRSRTRSTPPSPPSTRPAPT